VGEGAGHPDGAGPQWGGEAWAFAENRAMWDARVDIHVGSAFYDVEGWLRQGRGPRPAEAELVGDVTGLDLVHLQCHIGLDTLAWARAGARVTGVDFSAPALDAARAIATRAGLADRSRFVCANVYDAPGAVGATYDLVYVSLGALSWLPSVDRWAAVVVALLRPGGRLFVHDVHPLSDALGETELTVTSSYFEEPDPYIDDSSWTYTDGPRPPGGGAAVCWNHSLGEIVTAVLRRGLVLEALHEHDYTTFGRFPWLVRRGDGTYALPAGTPRVPLSFSLLARRP